MNGKRSTFIQLSPINECQHTTITRIRTFAFVCGLVYDGLCRNNFAVSEKTHKTFTNCYKNRHNVMVHVINKAIIKKIVGLRLYNPGFGEW